MSTLVTGAGLIGVLTARLLAERGESVVISDLRHGEVPDRASFVLCDVTDERALDDVIMRHDVRRIVHTAAMLSTGIRADPVRGIEVNVMGVARVLEAARRHSLGRVVLASSTTVGYSAFASQGSNPVAEDFRYNIVAERPASIYAASKIAGEHLALAYRDLYSVDAVIVRYAAVLGGRGAPTSVPGRLLTQLVTSAKANEALKIEDPYLVWGGREEFVDARDCARANVAALDAMSPLQRVYNIATGSVVTLAEFVDAVRRVHPTLRVEIPEGLVTGFAGFPHLRPAPSSTIAAAGELGFRCIYGLDDTIRFWTVA